MSALAEQIYDEDRLSRQLHSQRTLGWDLETRMDWALGVDLGKPLLPLDPRNLLFPSANAEQRLVISELMGLIVAATISQLERVALDLKGATWERVLDRYPVNPEFRELGEAFYEDEGKHSRAFSRYIDAFSLALNVEPTDFRTFLPRANPSLTKRIYEWNSLAGGMSIWWLIAAMEEESILIYRHLRPFRAQVDPLYGLYYQIMNRLTAGGYYHKNHHRYPWLYNPSRAVK